LIFSAKIPKKNPFRTGFCPGILKLDYFLLKKGLFVVIKEQNDSTLVQISFFLSGKIWSGE
ncbi:MAG: hypothetical protein RLZ62_889, partial [Bacteroidota bacterium]